MSSWVSGTMEALQELSDEIRNTQKTSGSLHCSKNSGGDGGGAGVVVVVVVVVELADEPEAVVVAGGVVVVVRGALLSKST